MDELADSVVAFVRETRALEALPTSTETSFYPDLKALLSAVLKHERLPFEVITGTSEGDARRRDMPDFVLGDSSLFVGVYGEVKRGDTSLSDLAVSTERNDQIGRYLSQTGVVLLCNVRSIGLLTCEPSFSRQPGQPVPPSKRVLEKTVDLWSAVSGSGTRGRADPAAIEDLVSLVTRAVTDFARIASPADLAKILARQARDAKDAMPDDLRPVKPLLDDYRQALGLAFDIDDPIGAVERAAGNRVPLPPMRRPPSNMRQHGESARGTSISTTTHFSRTFRRKCGPSSLVGIQSSKNGWDIGKPTAVTEGR